MTTAIPKREGQPICPQCESLTVEFRVRANGYICRRCGHRWLKSHAEEENAE